jgi:hypothetical protein
MVTRKDKSMNGLKYDDGKPRLDLVPLWLR